MSVIHNLEAILAKLPNLRIGLLGDLFLDRYFEIDPNLSETSIETGLEAHQVVSIRNVPGALGTIMNNLAALGVGEMLPLTVVGEDGLAEDLLRSLEKLPVDRDGVLQDPTRLTPTYQKPLVRTESGIPRELSRLDVRSRAPLSKPTCAKLIERLTTHFTQCDGWIVLDQVHETDCGVVNGHVREGLRDLCRRYPEKLVFIDSRRYLHTFDFGTLKGNQEELLRAAAQIATGETGEPGDGEVHAMDDVESAVRNLAHRTGRSVFVTQGSRGILCVYPSDPHEPSSGWQQHRSPAIAVSGPVDIVGAGDSATSGLVCGLLAGASPRDAAALANLVASITVQQLGTTGTANPKQVLEANG